MSTLPTTFSLRQGGSPPRKPLGSVWEDVAECAADLAPKPPLPPANSSGSYPGSPGKASYTLFWDSFPEQAQFSDSRPPRAACICTVLCCSHPDCDSHSFHSFPEHVLRAGPWNTAGTWQRRPCSWDLNQPWLCVRDFQLVSDTCQGRTCINPVL